MARSNLSSLLLVLACATPALATQQRPPARSDELTGVKRGDQVEDLRIFDAQGKSVAIRDLLKGHYTAIVMGCLT